MAGEWLRLRHALSTLITEFFVDSPQNNSAHRAGKPALANIKQLKSLDCFHLESCFTLTSTQTCPAEGGLPAALMGESSHYLGRRSVYLPDYDRL